MKLFLDTEFTDLVPDNKLISIALVDDNENYFYAELTDAYTLQDCSGFVKTDVLPFLRGGQYRMTFEQCADAIVKWIESRKGKCVIASDAPSWDIPHLNRLFQAATFPTNLEKGYVYPVILDDKTRNELVAHYGYDIHNALDDALVMKKGCHKILSNRNNPLIPKTY
jgi:hypothetical protein